MGSAVRERLRCGAWVAWSRAELLRMDYAGGIWEVFDYTGWVSSGGEFIDIYIYISVDL